MILGLRFAHLEAFDYMVRFCSLMKDIGGCLLICIGRIRATFAIKGRIMHPALEIIRTSILRISTC